MILFEEHYEELCLYAARLTGGAAAFEDFVEEGFLRLYARRLEGARVDNPVGWLVRTIRNQAIDYLRAHRTTLRECGPADVESAAGAGASPEAHLMNRERQILVRQAFASLPPQERACARLRARGLSYGEIAAQLEMSVNSVGPTLAHALRKLRLYVREGSSHLDQPSRRRDAASVSRRRAQ